MEKERERERRCTSEGLQLISIQNLRERSVRLDRFDELAINRPAKRLASCNSFLSRQPQQLRA